MRRRYRPGEVPAAGLRFQQSRLGSRKASHPKSCPLPRPDPDHVDPQEVRRLRERLAAAGRRLAREARGRRLYERISQTRDLRALLQVLGTEILALGDFDGYLFNFVDEAETSLVCEAIHLPPHCKSVEATYLGFRFPFHLLDANVEAFKKRRSVYVNETQVSKYPGTTQNRFERWDMRQLVVLPLLHAGTVYATVMAFTSGRAMAAGAEGRLRHLLAPFTQLIFSAHAYAHLRQREREIVAAQDASQALFRFIERINNLTEPEEIQALACQFLLQQYPADLAAVLLTTGSRLAFSHMHVRERWRPVREALLQTLAEGYPLDQSQGASPTVFLQDGPMFFPDVQEILHLRMAERDRRGLQVMGATRSFYLLPVRARGRPIGVLWLVSLEEPAQLSDPDKATVQLVAGLLGTALANAELHALVADQQRELRRLRSRAGADDA